MKGIDEKERDISLDIMTRLTHVTTKERGIHIIDIRKIDRIQASSILEHYNNACEFSRQQQRAL